MTLANDKLWLCRLPGNGEPGLYDIWRVSEGTEDLAKAEESYNIPATGENNPCEVLRYAGRYRHARLLSTVNSNPSRRGAAWLATMLQTKPDAVRLLGGACLPQEERDRMGILDRDIIVLKYPVLPVNANASEVDLAVSRYGKAYVWGRRAEASSKSCLLDMGLVAREAKGAPSGALLVSREVATATSRKSGAATARKRREAAGYVDVPDMKKALDTIRGRAFTVLRDGYAFYPNWGCVYKRSHLAQQAECLLRLLRKLKVRKANLPVSELRWVYAKSLRMQPVKRGHPSREVWEFVRELRLLYPRKAGKGAKSGSKKVADDRGLLKGAGRAVQSDRVQGSG